MNKKYLKLLVIIVVAFQSCSKSDDDATCDPNLSVEAGDVVNAVCGQSNGSIRAAATGGKGSLSYSLNGTDFQSSNNFEDLTPATYNLTVKDENGCTSSVTVAVTESSNMNVNFALTNAGCGGSEGKISATVAGGAEPYQYSINNGPFQTTAVFENLTRGDYSVKVKDANSCTTEANAKVLSGIGYSTTVSNIISTKCALPACHGGTQSPAFTAFNNIKSNAAAIKTRTGNKTMPPPGATALTDAEIAHIACWVDDGAPQN